MRCFIGIDLGSTTTKAVVIDEDRNVLGRGITNSRSNYDTAAAIAKQEALVNGRFHLFRQALVDDRRAQRRARRLPRPARARLPARAVPRAARRPRSDLPAQPRHREVRRRDGGRRRGAARGLPPARDGSAGALRARGQAQVRLLPRHRRQPVPRGRRGRGEGRRRPLRLPAQRVRPLDHRGREPGLRRLDPPPPPRRARADLRRAARDRGAPRRRSRRRSRASSTWTWRRPTSSAPATAARACRSPRSTSAPRSSATAWART